MNTTELVQLIQFDPVALAMAGHDEDAATRLREIADPVYEERLVTELSIYNIYQNPADAETVLCSGFVLGSATTLSPCLKPSVPIR